MPKLPKAFEQFKAEYPEVFAAYQRLGDATLEAGPLDGKMRELVKLGISLGAGMEGAAHSHGRRAREQGATPEGMRHVALLALPPWAFPR